MNANKFPTHKTLKTRLTLSSELDGTMPKLAQENLGPHAAQSGQGQLIELEAAGSQPQTRNSKKPSPTVFDVAACVLQQCGEMTAMKLQKLVYYCQAWSLVWDEEPIFEEEIQAWANGPVVPVLYNWHRGKFKVSLSPGSLDVLTEEQRETILKVLEFYGDMPSQTLINLTHREAPWVNARVGLGIGERGNRVITHAAMAEYYGSL